MPTANNETRPVVLGSVEWLAPPEEQVEMNLIK